MTEPTRPRSRPPGGPVVWFTCTGVLAVLFGVVVAWAAWPRDDSAPASSTSSTTSTTVEVSVSSSPPTPPPSTVTVPSTSPTTTADPSPPSTRRGPNNERKSGEGKGDEGGDD